ncbi:hypothetical protein G3I59_16310 [Amycolatopsis rubida]|uniref:Uncharacterized protein n=2 Tax=Amycolatopsis TaxID=1813 RepID=A0ABX0BTR0_9PSEU|nr:hypothetical protein [Amycolatopsis rubida]NEC57108.1 hypothetical protein [Amycolatopsis rubida]
MCKYPYIQSFAMYGDRGKRLYDLFYRTRELIGLDSMKAAMWKGPRQANSASVIGSLTRKSFSRSPCSAVPRHRHLLQHFAGQAVTIESVVDHVVAATPDASSHVKRTTLAPMQTDGLIARPNQARKNSYPNGTVIVFPDALA